MYSRASLSDRGFGPRPVTVVEHFSVHFDGFHLAGKAWFPEEEAQTAFPSVKGCHLYCQSEEGFEVKKGKYPTVLEFLPYRKSDCTARRDHVRHPWLASQAFVVVRFDLRGSGESTGVYGDEYQQQEFDDACRIIGELVLNTYRQQLTISFLDWISDQPWSNGRVGMFGKSWGGFNGLQVAFERPPALKAVISLYSTDDRFADDIHWKGGCVLGNGMLSWGSIMNAWNARPPYPE